MKLRSSLLCFAAFLPFARAQIRIVDSGATGNQVNLGSSYTQSFDSLANSTTAPVPWTNNSTLPAWYVYDKIIAVNSYSPSQGGPTAFGSFGTLGNPDRALGSALGAPSGDVLHFGVQFVNASALTITGVNISFDGEQWYYGTSSVGVVESLDFSYQVFDAGQGDISATSGWIADDNLKFISPINDGTTNRALDGNLPANRVAGIADSLAGLTLAPGQEVWLRWTATNTVGITDHALAIDNLSVRFTAVPEPAACAVLAGLVGLVAMVRRRRR